MSMGLPDHSGYDGLLIVLQCYAESVQYAAGATVQILMFSILACKVKQNAPRCHTWLEIIYVSTSFSICGADLTTEH